MISAVIFILSVQILVSCVFGLYFLAIKRFISFIDRLKQPVLGVIVFIMVFPLSTSLISTLIFILYFLLFTSDISWSSFLLFERAISSS